MPTIVPPLSQATRLNGPVSSSRIGSEPNRSLYQGTLRSRLVTVSATWVIAGNSGISFLPFAPRGRSECYLFDWQLSGSKSYLAAPVAALTEAPVPAYGVTL